MRDMFLDARIDIGKRADGAGNRAHRYLLACGEEAGAGARELRVEPRELQAERGGLGVNAVAPADRDRILELEGAALEGGKESLHIGDQDVARAPELNGEAG